MFDYGDNVTLRSTINGRLWMIQSVTVVKETPQETLLLLEPGAECAYPSGYWRWKRGNTLEGTRWDDINSMAWTLREFKWHTHRLLIHMIPEKYYSIYMIWDGVSGAFKSYYVNFQTPFQRRPSGYDMLDLELDIVINPDFTWSYKDGENYLLGLREGCITQKQHCAVEEAKIDALSMIHDRNYPLDGSWINWRPDPDWQPARLPAGWEKI